MSLQDEAKETIDISGSIKSATGTPIMSSLGYRSIVITPTTPLPPMLSSKVAQCRLTMTSSSNNNAPQKIAGLIAVRNDDIEFIPLKNTAIDDFAHAIQNNVEVVLSISKVLRDLRPVDRGVSPELRELIQQDIVRVGSFSDVFDKSTKKRLSAGTFGILYSMARRLDGKEFAVRVIDKRTLTGTEFSRIENEIDVLKSVYGTHEHVLGAYGVFGWTDDTKTNVRIVTELCTSPNLERVIQRNGNLSEMQTQTYLIAIARALRFLHGQSIVHRDLCAKNILFTDDGVLKVSGFYWANRTPGVVVDDIFMNAMAGSSPYVAPEVLSREEYGFQVDYWSLGVLTYLMLSGKLPFTFEENVKTLFETVLTGEYDKAVLEGVEVSEEGRDCVRNLLSVDVASRLNGETLWEHPWIRSVSG